MRCSRLFCLLSVLLCSVGQALETEPMLQRETQEPVEELLYDGKGLPRLHRYDEEDTAFLSALSSRTVVTRAAGTFSRNLYDEDYRLQSRLTWQESGSEAASEGSIFPARLTLQEEYFYYENSRSRQKVVLTDFSQSRRTERFYSQGGLLTREEVYEIDEKKTLNHIVEYFYTAEGDLTEKQITHQGRALVEKTQYHRPGNVHGGYDYFENGVLLVSRKYQDESVYTETRYFDNMKIEAKYNGARLLSEVVYLDGTEIRRTDY